MSVATVPVPEATRPTLGSAAGDALAVAQRNLIGLFRVPTTLVFSTIQPVIFVLMFRYVFGGASQTPGYRYVDYLMAGIFVQTVTFGSINTGVGLAIDLSKGLIERFGSLPMARSAVRRVGGGVPRPGHRGPVRGGHAAPAAVRVRHVVRDGLSGLGTGNAEAAQAAAFPLMAVLVFASNVFVPTATMPGPLRAYADHQPVGDTVDAVRGLLAGTASAPTVLAAVAWSVAIVAVLAPLAVRRYRRSA